MKITIHRGTHEIGGTCIELESENARILLDYGLPLIDKNKNQFDMKSIKHKSKTELIKQGILHDIKGLYKDEKPGINGILLTHSHPDHYGALSFIHPDIPVYMSNGCNKLIEIFNFFELMIKTYIINKVIVKDKKNFQINDIIVTPFRMDHSGFDALAYLIENKDKRIFYTGDFRGHGRKDYLFEEFCKKPPKNIDYLIIEGTSIGREET